MDWQSTEIQVLEWLRAHGFPTAGLTATGADGGVDVQAPGIVVQVKAFTTQNVGRPAVQQLAGIAASSQSRPLFFTTSGYTRAAEEWATGHGVALFVLHSEARVQPLNSHATKVASRKRAHLPSDPAPHSSTDRDEPPQKPDHLPSRRARKGHHRPEEAARPDPRLQEIRGHLKRRDVRAYSALIDDMVGHLHPVEPIRTAVEVRRRGTQGLMVITNTRMLYGRKEAMGSKIVSYFIREVDDLTVGPAGFRFQFVANGKKMKFDPVNETYRRAAVSALTRRRR